MVSQLLSIGINLVACVAADPKYLPLIKGNGLSRFERKIEVISET